MKAAYLKCINLNTHDYEPVLIIVLGCKNVRNLTTMSMNLHKQFNN